MENVNKKSNLCNLSDILDYVQQNDNILNCYIKANNVLDKFESPVCSISGGRDSDIMLDILSRIDRHKKIIYVWFDTGVEYQATKDHLDYLEQKYGIHIIRAKAVKPIPTSCKEYGQPFISKHVSEMMSRLQKHNFQWEDEPFDDLIKKYPKCRCALLWWTNGKPNTTRGYSQFNIGYNKFLKEFIVAHPPTFKISSKCCEYAKKKVAHKFEKDYQCDLSIIGVRKSEGGVRSASYKNCFSDNDDKVSQYRPLFWFSNDDEVIYDKLFDISHSDCYSIYGLKRTGCVGCPFGKELNHELEVMEQYEPKLAKAAKNIFKDSYEYTRRYRQFVEEMKRK